MAGINNFMQAVPKRNGTVHTYPADVPAQFEAHASRSTLDAHFQTHFINARQILNDA
jgi:hypothetical protein